MHVIGSVLVVYNMVFVTITSGVVSNSLSINSRGYLTPLLKISPNILNNHHFI